MGRYGSGIGLGILGALALALGVNACSDDGGGGSNPTMTLTATQTELPADGKSSTIITVAVTPAVSGLDVEFRTTAGSFDDDDPEHQVEYATLTLGQAQIELFAPSLPATASVSAAVEPLIESITITFSGDTTPRPSARFTSFSCQSVNLAGFATGGAQMECTLIVRDRDSNPLHYDTLMPLVEIKAEAGTFENPVEQSQEDYEYAGHALHYVYRASGVPPADVAPDEALEEPSRSKAGGTANPRDGLVTLLAVVRGEEHCQGTVTGDQCDGFFDDLPEPFVDVDDDGEYGGGDLFLYDENGDTQANTANGRWDRDWPIGIWAKVLWTGPPTPGTDMTEIRPLRHDIANGDEATFEIRILDENLNPPAANGDGGDLRIDNSVGQLEGDVSSVTLPSTLGMDLDPEDGHVTGFHFNDLGWPYRHRATISDDDPTDEDPPTDGTLTAEISELYMGPEPDVGSDYSPEAFPPIQLEAELSVD